MLRELNEKAINSNNRISKKFEELSNKKECALICYLVAGYPDLTTTEKLAYTLAKAGADIIELGIPFSDPIADGPTIQQASYEALVKGITPHKCLMLSKYIRNKFPDLPIIAMTYSNILLKAGFSEFMDNAKYFGVDGLILPDMSIDECSLYIKQASQRDLATIFLISPNVAQKRLEAIVDTSSGFLYLISVYGTTGTRQHFENYTFDAIRKIKKTSQSKIPLAVGFGISNPSHVKFMISAGADGVIIGSAIVKKVQSSLGKKNMLSNLAMYIKSLKAACNKE
jgi:tryptophan synthase alpha chain